MLKRKTTNQSELEFVSIETLVPKDHLLRKLDRHIDFGFIYDKVEHLYCKDNGRPPVDPVMLFKMFLVGYLYPKDLEELELNFSSEEACRDYLASLRRPKGFVCPACGHAESWRLADGLFKCKKCSRKTSVISGTIFEGTRKPLAIWFRAIWWVTSQKNGASALGLMRVLGLGSYKTAWTWLHKLRRAMVRPGPDKLDGTVQVDETFIGGAKPGKRGRGADGKSLVLIVAQENGKAVGRIRLVIPQYVSYAETRNACGTKLEVVQEAERLRIVSHMQFFDDIPVVRCWAEVTNISSEPVGLEYVSSFALAGLTKRSPVTGPIRFGSTFRDTPGWLKCSGSANRYRHTASAPSDRGISPCSARRLATPALSVPKSCCRWVCWRWNTPVSDCFGRLRVLIPGTGRSEILPDNSPKALAETRGLYYCSEELKRKTSHQSGMRLLDHPIDDGYADCF